MVAPTLDRLYSYDTVRNVRESIRPLKHFVFGKSDIYYVLDAVKRARTGLDPVRVVFDIGAAVGDKARTFLRTFRDARVYCFEPHASALERCAKRVAPWRDRVELFAFGLYKENRRAMLNVCSYRDASSVLPMQHFLREQGKREIGVESIALRRLDDCLPDLGVARIDFMKIDVEGVEREVLEGATKTLSLTENVYVEIEPRRHAPDSGDHIEVFRLLHEAGFAFIGPYGDYWFSKDRAIMKVCFGEGAAQRGADESRRLERHD